MRARGARAVACAAVAGLGLGVAGAPAAGRLVLDLESGKLNGHQVLGQQIGAALAELTAAGLGRPTARIDMGAGIVALRYGPERGFRALVLFRPTATGVIATSLGSEDAAVADPAAGVLLGVKPKVAVARALHAHQSLFRHEVCVPACPLQLLSVDGRLRVAFGSAAGRRFVRVDLAQARS